MTITGGAPSADWDLLVETAYDRAVEFYFRDDPQWRQLIDKRPERQAMPGDSVVLTRHDTPMALATTPLTETVDVTAVALPTPTRVTVSLAEYGNAAATTIRLEKTAFTAPEAEKAELLGRNMHDTVDQLIRAVADSSTNILYKNGGVLKTSGGAFDSVVAADTMKRDSAVVSVKLLQRAKVPTKGMNRYLAVIHPDVSFDLQAENSANVWSSPHVYQDTAALYSGEVGDYMGARYIETTRITSALNANAIPTVVYNTYYFGRGGLVEVSAVDPHTVVGPQVDSLKRFYTLGWYALAGWGLYRPQALVVTKTASSISTL